MKKERKKRKVFNRKMMPTNTALPREMYRSNSARSLPADRAGSRPQIGTRHTRAEVTLLLLLAPIDAATLVHLIAADLSTRGPSCVRGDRRGGGGLTGQDCERSSIRGAKYEYECDRVTSSSPHFE